MQPKLNVSESNCDFFLPSVFFGHYSGVVFRVRYFFLFFLVIFSCQGHVSVAVVQS